jgi:hypothetical protein
MGVSRYIGYAGVNKHSHSLFDQSKPVGHNNAPVHSWLNPWSALILRDIKGLSGWPRGMIQSRITLFKLLVSSDLAFEAPFWIYRKKFGQVLWEVGNEIQWTHQFSNMWHSFLRTAHQTFFKARYCLEKLFVYVRFPLFPRASLWVYSLNTKRTYSVVNDSSGCPTSSMSHKSPLVNRAWMLHRAWIVQPKCRL